MMTTLPFSYLEIPENQSNKMNKMRSLSQFTSVDQKESKSNEEESSSQNIVPKVTDDDVTTLSKNMQGEEESKDTNSFHKPKCKSKSSLGSLDDEDCEEEEEDDTAPNIESFNSNLEDKKYFVPYYNRVANEQNIDGVKDQIHDKLNYLIHMLEEQQNEKTDQVTEELLLYFFLGVFIIFLVDSFVRVGKYTR